MADHNIDNMAELVGAKAESVASMRVVAGRCLNAEKMAWTLDYVMEKQPRAQDTLETLADLLHDYLATTATMVKKIQHDQMAIKLAEMNRDEG